MSTTTRAARTDYIVAATDLPDVFTVAGIDGVIVRNPIGGVPAEVEWVAYLYGRRIGARFTAQAAARILATAAAGVARPEWAAPPASPVAAVASVLDDNGVPYDDEPVGLILHVDDIDAVGTLVVTDAGAGRVTLAVYPNDSWTTGATDDGMAHTDIPAVIVAAIYALTR